jgi:hypothetical protein
LAFTRSNGAYRQSRLGIDYHLSFYLNGVTMEPKYLYTIRWTQPYPTDRMRPYLRQLREDFEKIIEARLERKEFAEAEEIIRRIQDANKS